jgi:hypothetical protein
MVPAGRIVLAVALAAVLGCEGSEGVTLVGPPGGIIEVDPNTIPIGDARPDGGAGAGGGGGAPGQGCASEPALINANGVLTAFPRIVTSVVPAGLSLKSVNFVVTEDGDPRGPLIEMFGEIVNTGTLTECSFLPDVFLGFDELITIVEADPHFGTFVTSVTTDCIGPGRTGVMNGVQRGITRAELDMATSLTVNLNPSRLDTYRPATNGPLRTGQITVTATGWAVRGQLTIGTTIRNYGMRVYPKDGRGLLFAELLAFPGNLAPLYAGSTIDFETESAHCAFGEYLVFDSWIVGAN